MNAASESPSLWRILESTAIFAGPSSFLHGGDTTLLQQPGRSIVNLRHIVVATDESDAGRQAVRAGLELAARAAARLTVMRAASVRAVPLMGAMAGGAEDTELDGAGMALERLQHWLAAEVIPAGTGVPVELGIAFGVPGIEICRFAEQRAADLLVLGRKHRSPMARLLVGDTADAVLRRSRVPCLFVQPGSGPFREALVALDGSERGMRVLTATRGFARSVGAALRAVTVEDQQPSPASAPAVPSTRSSRLQREVASIVSRETGPHHVEDSGVAIRRGAIVREILAEVAESHPDVLAFGYHRGGPPGIIEGSSTGRQLAHTAPVSVLAIPL
jgi:nucleotide-binding universal stress UspA family protein